MLIFQSYGKLIGTHFYSFIIVLCCTSLLLNITLVAARSLRKDQAAGPEREEDREEEEDEREDGEPQPLL